MSSVVQNGKDWVNIFSALLTPIIAISVGIIAFLQWRTNANRLKHELFDRRYGQFEVVYEFIYTILNSGESNQDERYKFLKGTRGMGFIFDKEFKEYIDKTFYNPALKLEELDMEIQGLSPNAGSGEKGPLLKRKNDIKIQMRKDMEELIDRFSKFLKLRH